MNPPHKAHRSPKGSPETDHDIKPLRPIYEPCSTRHSFNRFSPYSPLTTIPRTYLSMVKQSTSNTSKLIYPTIYSRTSSSCQYPGSQMSCTLNFLITIFNLFKYTRASSVYFYTYHSTIFKFRIRRPSLTNNSYYWHAKPTNRGTRTLTSWRYPNPPYPCINCDRNN